MTQTRELLAKLANVVADIAEGKVTARRVLVSQADTIAAECRAEEGQESPRVETQSGTWTLTNDPDCPRSWEHRRDDGTVDSLVYADEVAHMYQVQQGQGFDKGRSIGKAGVDAPPPLASAGDTPPPPAPSAADDVETVRDGLRKGAYGRPSEIRDAAEALKRIAARLAHLEGQQRLCEIDCANQEARGNDAESRLAQFEALAERAHNALDGDNMIAGVRVLHDLAALRREGV